MRGAAERPVNMRSRQGQGAGARTGARGAALLLSALSAACQTQAPPAKPGAAEHGAGGHLSLGYTHRAEPAQAPSNGAAPGADPPARRALAGRHPEGHDVEITGLYLVTSAIEVHACEPGLDAMAHAPSLPARLWHWVVPEVQAHVPDSQNRLGVPYVEDLLAEPRSARIVGSIAPPLGRYCRIYAVISPADDDLLNLTDVSSEDILGKSLLVRGRWRPDGVADWQDFSLSTDSRRAQPIALRDPLDPARPLAFDRNGDQAMVLLDKPVDEGLVRHLTQAVLRGELVPTDLEDAIVSGLVQYRPAPPPSP